MSSLQSGHVAEPKARVQCCQPICGLIVDLINHNRHLRQSDEAAGPASGRQ